MRPASPACLRWRRASSMASGSMSLPAIWMGRLEPSSYFRRASRRISFNVSMGTQGHISMANFRVRPGARPKAMKAASMSSVPVPQQGS